MRLSAPSIADQLSWHQPLQTMKPPASYSRTLLFSLGFSLLLHALLLAGAPHLHSLRLDAPGTVIRVVINHAAAPASESAESVRSEKAPPAALPASKRVPPAKRAPPAKPLARKNSVAPLVVRQETPQQVASPASIASADVSLPSGENHPLPTVSGSANTTAGEGVAPVPLTAGRETRDGPNADDLRQYRLSLAAAARRFKRYPALARERGWEGRVELAIGFRGALPVPEVTLLRSSGRKLLDEQALATMQQAVQAVALPDSLRGRNFHETLAMQFSLEDEPGAAP